MYLKLILDSSNILCGRLYSVYNGINEYSANHDEFIQGDVGLKVSSLFQKRVRYLFLNDCLYLLENHTIMKEFKMLFYYYIILRTEVCKFFKLLAYNIIGFRDFHPLNKWNRFCSNVKS